ncbi:signal peptidase I [Candidatus Pantoea edessiphila]|uniref:Signal peptidase I n=1 Tax=Candidatus Pantoea edessiphila TaxID=2044610 RepID=A0A2P5SYD4_9GAMM|nr:signal peptidase I [Candidatus Pantoea edessiphila]MBK4775530.1 signal peptidase I [Pantoea sp. Edef]PPI87344.1 signal peptidase I [Candidatus Pantoea edessiphila]
MINNFSLILLIVTLCSGIIWVMNFFKWSEKKAINISEEIKIIPAKSFEKSTDFISSIFPLLLVVFCFRSFLYEPFQIPSGSMMPTLLVGDFILVKKFSYAIKNPITLNTLIKISKPKRGDIAVFKYPNNPKINYIKRIVSMPGDRITYNSYSKTIQINPECGSKKKCNNLLQITYTNIEPSSFIQIFNKNNNSFYKLSKEKEDVNVGFHLNTRKETIGKLTHDILLTTETVDQTDLYYQQDDQPLGSWIVPEGQYFVMGDNRDNSSDSRYWGFVPEEYFIGKAVCIWMSLKKQEGMWPTGIRSGRFGIIK